MTGVLSGTPTKVGDSTVTVQTENAVNTAYAEPVTISVKPAPDSDSDSDSDTDPQPDAHTYADPDARCALRWSGRDDRGHRRC